MTSANFIIQTDVLSQGGGRSTSDNFIVEDTLGDLATGEGLSSASFQACSGFQCFLLAPYITFSVAQGLVSPGTVGAGVSLGTLTADEVTTSNGSVNSIFLEVESNGAGGTAVTVRDENGGLKRTASSSTIVSATASLVEGAEGYGVCAMTVGQDAGSPTSLAKSAPYNGTCDTTTGHDVGIVDTTNRTIVSSSGAVKAGTARVLVKASIATTTAAGNDYADTLTFVATATY